MCVKSKKITSLILGLVIIAIVLIGGCEKFEEPRPVSLDDRPMIAYMKEEYKKRDGVVYSLKISSFDGGTQIVAMGCLGVSTGAQGSIIGFKLERGDAYHNDLYFLERSGESRLVAEDITSYEQSINGYSFCASQPQDEELIYRKILARGKFITGGIY